MPRNIRVIQISIFLIFIFAIFPNISVGATTTYVINGNAGVGEAVLSYFDGSPKFVISDSDGNYSLSVASNWSGKVVPNKTGHSFTPAGIDYADVAADQLNQDYSASDNTCEPYGNAGETSRISLLPNGTTGNYATYMPKISANGCYAAFYSDASNLVDADVNNVGDIFIRNMSTQVINFVSVSSSGAQGNSANRSTDDNIAISADGRYVAFNTTANNLVDGDTNGYRDVFLHDTHTRITTLVSKLPSGVQGNGDSYYPSVSADGRYIAFASRATNFFTGDTNARSDVFVHDTLTGTTVLVSKSSSGILGDYGGDYPSISADGRYIAFESFSSNLVIGDTNLSNDIFVRDLQTSTTFRASVNSSGVQGENGVKTAFSYLPAISANGRYVVFTSQASNLVSGDTNAKTDIFLRDIIAGTTERISVSNSGTQANSATEPVCSISADGRYVVFSSKATNLSGDADDGAENVFLRDRATGVTRQLQFSSTFSTTPDISANGQYVMVLSIATSWDGFVYINDITPPTTSGIEDIKVNRDAQNTSIDLWEAFADTENSDSTLAYTITGNTNPSLFTSATVPTLGGQYLILDFDPEAIGSTTMTVRATDPAGLFVETSFMVSVMGNVMISGNTEVGGVTLSYTDVTSKTSTSNLDGSYSFTVPYNWNGTVTAFKPGYTFSPLSRIYANVSADQMGQDYLPLLVTNTNDDGPGSLRHIITNAITGDTITFASFLSSQAIHLSSSLLIDKGITIDGSNLTPHAQINGDTDGDGDGDVQLMQIAAAATVHIQGVDFINGRSTSSLQTGGINNLGSLALDFVNFTGNSGDQGGAIRNSGQLTINHSTFIGNSALEGGVILNDAGGTAIISTSKFIQNSVEGNFGTGGAIGNIGSLTINDSEFTENTATLGGGAIVNGFEGNISIADVAFTSNSTNTSGAGGAIYNIAGKITVSDSIFYLNSSYKGGAVHNRDEMSILWTNFIENTANQGGGIFCDTTSVLTVTGGHIESNDSINDGGGIYNFGGNLTSTGVNISNNVSTNFGGGGIANTGTLNVTNNTISGNSTTGYGGGGIVNSGVLTMTNSTIVNNTANNAASDGGGILTVSTATIINSTISGNTARRNGGGIYNSGALHLKNTILANSTLGQDCYNSSDSIATNTNNLIEANGSSGHQCGMPLLSNDPNLETLADNGGLTHTMALLDGSPAINTGDNVTCAPTDQRGITRPQGAQCDIGAFEYVDNIPPSVLSITRGGTAYTSAASVDFIVTFSELVMGVGTVAPFDDFTLTTSPGISDASIMSVSVSGTVYTVTVDTGTGAGTIRLDVASTNIADLAGNPLASLPFTSGEIYTITTTSTFSSSTANDGWVLETGESTNSGGVKDANGFLRVGDDIQNKQYRSILYFNTTSLPDNAIPFKVTLKVKQAGITGVNPFTTHGSLLADMAKGFFGKSVLENTDFQAQGIPAPNVGSFAAVAGEPGWYELVLSPANAKYINPTGMTQFRLRFARDDDNDRKADFISFYGGEDVTNPPQLIVEYTTP